MLYENNLKDTIVDTLNAKVSTIVDSMLVLLDEGYIPNQRKITQLNWSSILIHAFENISVFSEEQQKSLENLFNTIIR